MSAIRQTPFFVSSYWRPSAPALLLSRSFVQNPFSIPIPFSSSTTTAYNGQNNPFEANDRVPNLLDSPSCRCSHRSNRCCTFHRPYIESTRFVRSFKLSTLQPSGVPFDLLLPLRLSVHTFQQRRIRRLLSGRSGLQDHRTYHL